MMKSSLIVVLAAVVATSAKSFGRQKCGIRGDSGNYILGGDDATPLEFPWQVSLQMSFASNSWQHNCGGSIIDENWILTAAHCVDSLINGDSSVSSMRAVVGAHNIAHGIEELASAHPINRDQDVFMHPMWDFAQLDYDYALIQLPKPLNFSGVHSHLMPICMPTPNESNNFENMECMASGWGVTKNSWDPADMPDVLQKLPVRVVKQDVCIRAYTNTERGTLRITPRHICIVSTRGEGSGPCRGDSGGPLQCKVSGRYVLAGATSFGLLCGSVEYPGVFARTTEVLNWINKIRETKTRH